MDYFLKSNCKRIVFFQLYWDTIDITLCKFKVYTDDLIRIHVVKCFPVRLVNTSLTSHNYRFVVIVKTLKLYSHSNCQLYNSILLTYCTLDPWNLLILQLKVYAFWPVSPYFPHPTAPGNHILPFLWVHYF